MVSHSNRNQRRPATEPASQTWNTPTGATMSIMNRNRTRHVKSVARTIRGPNADRGWWSYLPRGRKPLSDKGFERWARWESNPRPSD